MFLSLRNPVLALLLTLAVSCKAVKRSRFTFYEMPTPESGPCDMVPGPDGAIWVQDIAVSKIARIDTNTSKVEDYDIPYKNKAFDRKHLPTVKGRTPIACSIQVGFDGMLYAVTGLRNELAKINPKTKEITVFTPKPHNPAGNLEPFNDLAPAKNGIYFSQTTANLITFFDYKTHKTKNYRVPTPGSNPVGVFIASDESVWICEFAADKIARLNTTDGTFKEYPLPPTLGQPVVMRVQQGKYLFFTAVTGNSIGRIDMETGDLKAFPSPALLVGPGSNIPDKRGIIWYSSLTQNVLGRLNPRTGVSKAIRTPILGGGGVNPPTAELSLTYSPLVNSVFFPDTLANRVGRLQLF